MFSEFAMLLRKRIIKKQVRKNRSIIYGAQSINQQIHPFGRTTFDYDVMSKHPRKSAKQYERTLDNKTGRDMFYSEPSKVTKNVHKVYWKGADRKKGTQDDIHLADFTQMKKIRTVKINGVRYSHLSESIKDKKSALRDPQYKFRWEKDREDLRRIKNYKIFRGKR